MLGTIKTERGCPLSRDWYPRDTNTEICYWWWRLPAYGKEVASRQQHISPTLCFRQRSQSLCCQYLSRVLVPRFCFLLYNLLYIHTFTIRSNLTSHENDHIHFLFVQHWLFLHLFSSSLLPSWKPYICRSCDNFVSTFWYTQHKQRLEDGTLKTPAIALKYEKDKISKVKSPSK